MGTLEALTLGSISNDWCSGRVLSRSLDPRKRFSDSFCNSAFVEVAGSTGRFSPVSAFQIREKSSSSSLSAVDWNGGREKSLFSRQSFEGEDLCGLLGHWNRRAGRVSCFSTSPAVDTSQVTSVEEEMIEDGLPAGLRPELMPKHVAIIMDGNSRWAKKRGLHVSAGHAAGADAMTKIALAASKWGIDAVTIFAFSSENWRRSKMEVDCLMRLFRTRLDEEIERLMRHNVRLRFGGDVSALPPSLQRTVESARERTSVNKGMFLNICCSYSGREDLVRACKQLAVQVAEGNLSPSDIDAEAISKHVFLGELGSLQNPDLVIRTSGEQRISNFLLWQVAYSEFVFPDTLFPDFRPEDFKAALLTYQQRDRRYGSRNDSIHESISKEG